MLIFALIALLVFVMPGYALLRRFSNFSLIESLAMAPVLSTALFGALFLPLHFFLGANPSPALISAIVVASFFGIRGTKASKEEKKVIALFMASFALRLVLVAYESEPIAGDNMWYYVLAKSFSTDNWYSMEFIDNFWSKQTFPFHPSYRPPLYPFSLSMLTAFGAKYTGALAFNAFFGAMLVFPAYLISRRMLPEQYALYATALISLNSWILDKSLNLTPYLLVIYYSLLLYHLFYREANLGAWRYIGITAALGYLTHYTFVISLAALGLVAAATYRKKIISRNLIYTLLIFLAFIFPWLVRNYLLFGNPVYSETRFMIFARGWEDYLRLSPPAPKDFFARPLQTFLMEKGGETLNTFAPLAGPARDLLFQHKIAVSEVFTRLFLHPACYNFALFCVLTPPLFFLAFAGLLLASPLRKLTLANLGVGLFFGAFLIYGYNNPGGDLQFMPAVLPLLIISGVYYLKRKAKNPQAGLLVIALFVLAYGAYALYLNHGGDARYADTYPHQLQRFKDSGALYYLKENTAAGEVIMSNDPLTITYRIGRPTLSIPNEDERTVLGIYQKYSASFLVLTNDNSSAPPKAGYLPVFSSLGHGIYILGDNWVNRGV